MLRVLSSSASALNAQQFKVDILANNLANINTPGFKESRADFSELVGQEVLNSGVPVARGNNNAVLGSGVRVAEIVKNFKPGSYIETGRLLDLAIQGEGFFKVVLNGEERYTRDGNFNLDQKGDLVTSSGYKLEGIQLAPGSDKVTISPDGTVKAEQSGNVTEAGQIQLYKFASVAELKAEGENLFSLASGEVLPGSPGNEGFGMVRQGCLETANVDLVEEMANLIEAQRAYGFNARTVHAADEMWSMANNLRK